MNDDSDVSSLETHFVERPDDAETLWEVEEIVGEKSKYYRVRWGGVDDDGEPWPLDWVPKSDCTDPLVRTWQRKKAEKKKRKQLGRKSLASRASTASTSTKVSETSSSTVTNITASKPNKGKSVAGSKRKHPEHNQKPNSSTIAQEPTSDMATSGRPKKRRKVAVELSSPSAPTTSRFRLDSPDVPARKVSPQTSSAKLRTSRPRILPYVHYESSSDDEPPPTSAKPRTSRPRILSYVHYGSSSDDESPSTGHLKPPSSINQPTPRRAVDSKPRTNQSASTRGSKRAVQEEEEEEEEVSTHLPRENQNGTLKKHKSSDSSTSPTPIPTHKERSSPRSPSGKTSSRSPTPTGPAVPAVVEPSHASPLFLPVSPSSRSASLEKAEQARTLNVDTDDLINGSARQNDDGDSALEYVDYPPHPPSSPPPLPAQPKTVLPFRSISFSPSPPPQALPSPVTSKGKGRAIELEPEFVPETEGEESQESHKPSRELSRTPSKNSMISRMRPRTPGSKRNIADADIITSPLPFDERHSASPHPRDPKLLRPIPQITPSKFANLPSSTVESVETGGGDESSIEQFDSPDKSSRRVNKKDVAPQERIESSVNSSLVPSGARDVVNKGVVMAEAAKRAKQTLISALAKIPLTNILEKERERPHAPELEQKEVGSQEQEAELTTPEKIALADSFVDYGGGVGEEVMGVESSSRTQDTTKQVTSIQAQKVYLRQEEEESTQDLLGELQEQRAVPEVNEGWAYPVPEPVQMDSADEDVNIINSLEVAPKSSAPLPETSQEESLHLEHPSQPLQVQPSPSPPLDSSFVVPATMESPKQPEQTTVSPLRTTAAQEDMTHDLDSAMNLLNKKSEEIARLENLLAAARSTIQTLEAATTNGSAMVGGSWKEETTKLLEENKTLQASLKATQDRLAWSEKNADVFRDQYLRVSSFVTDLRQTNAELQERAEVAESQAQSGIASVRTMFEMRVKELEEEALHQRRVTTFLIEQGQRTQDEDIRRRAAEHPELERRYAELEEKNSDLEGMLDGARGMIDTFEKLVTLRDRENESLTAENRRMKEMNQLSKESDVGRSENRDAVRAEEAATASVTNGAATEVMSAKQEKMGGDIQVYRCLWRKNGTEHCDAIFLTQEVLGHHLEFGGHIP